MALFFTSGTLGLAMGPTYFSAIVEYFGLERLSIAVVPALLVAALLFWRLPPPHQHVSDGKIDTAAFRRQWKPLLLHYGLVVLRSVVQVGMAQFMTLYLYNERGFTLKQAGLGLTVFFFAAAVGSFTGGGLADRIGGKRVILVSMIGSAPFLLLFLHTSGLTSMLCLFVGATLLLFTIPVNVVMAQELLPSQAGTVTSIMMGFAWGMAGITAVPAIGWFADRVGIASAFEVLAVLPLLGFLLALKLPAVAGPAEENSV
jgi:FSR family fosmidomycin resistance protein-like MFS transporter